MEHISKERRSRSEDTTQRSMYRINSVGKIEMCVACNLILVSRYFIMDLIARLLIESRLAHARVTGEVLLDFVKEVLVFIVVFVVVIFFFAYVEIGQILVQI